MKALSRARRAGLAVGALATAGIAVAFPVDVAASPVTPAAGDAELEVIASGLNHPRGITFGPKGSVIIAEAGREGEQPCLPPSPGTGDQPACFSSTGSVTVVAGGRQTRRLSGLPTLGDPGGTATAGPHDVMLTSRGLRLLFGYAHNPGVRGDLGPDGTHLGQLVDVDREGNRRPVADLVAHELAHNPGGEPGFFGVFSNPYAFVRDGHSTLVADSGANTVLRVSSAGQVSTEAVMPSRLVVDPFTGETIPMESVPTGIARGGDGSVYVGELTGYPFPVGAARVFELTPGGAPRVVAGGFTTVIDVALDNEGRLLVLEHQTNGTLSGDPTGALKRVEADGSTTTLVSSGLNMPTNLAVRSDGAIYISNNGTSVGDGEVVRILPDA